MYELLGQHHFEDINCNMKPFKDVRLGELRCLIIRGVNMLCFFYIPVSSSPSNLSNICKKITKKAVFKRKLKKPGYT